MRAITAPLPPFLPVRLGTLIPIFIQVSLLPSFVLQIIIFLLDLQHFQYLALINVISIVLGVNGRQVVEVLDWVLFEGDPPLEESGQVPLFFVGLVVLLGGAYVYQPVDIGGLFGCADMWKM